MTALATRLVAAAGLLLAAVVAMAEEGAAASPANAPAADQVVWYEVFVRSFQDSDGDGIGDLRGVTQRLEYLAELGIGGLWLMPIHPSPSYHGYDVTDYRAVNPDYGTLDDLTELLGAAHELGMRVIIDLVPNHTSDQHPWFVAALGGDPVYRDYYVWADDPPDWQGALGSGAWHEAGDTHYLGLFSPRMPDLNHRNPAVMAEVFDVARYWLELGVDGFRVDGIQHVIESEEGLIANSPENYAWVKAFQSFVREVAPDAVVLGETWTVMPAIVRYHREAGLHMSFDYPLWSELTGAIARRSASDLGFVLEQELALYPEGAVRATFTSNHDQARLATQLSVPRRDERRIKLAASLLLTLPGTPFVYYGEEIGMVDGAGSHDVEKRTPMRWEEAPDLGFTTGTPWTDPGPATPGVNVRTQSGEASSVLEHYRALIQLRNARPALNRGATTVLESGHVELLVLARSAAGETLYVLANLSARAVELGDGVLPDGSLTDLLSGESFTGVVPGLSVLVLDPE